MDINIWNHLKSDLSVIQSLWILNSLSLPTFYPFFFTILLFPSLLVLLTFPFFMFLVINQIPFSTQHHCEQITFHWTAVASEKDKQGFLHDLTV